MSSSDPKNRPKPGPWPPAPDSAPIPPSSWAKRTGFRPKFSGETNASDSGQISLAPKPEEREKQPDLEVGRVRTTRYPAPVPVPAAAPSQAVSNGEGEKVPIAAATVTKDQAVKRRRDSDTGLRANGDVNGDGSGRAGQTETNQQPQRRRVARNEEAVVVDGMEDDGFTSRHSHMNYQLRDTPGLSKSFKI